MNPLAILRTEPAAVYVTALGSVAALIILFAHLDAAQAGALSAAATATGTIITALLARPWHVAVIAGAAGTILQAATILGAHLDSQQIGGITAAVSLILGVIAMRPNLTPVASLTDTGSHAKGAAPPLS